MQSLKTLSLLLIATSLASGAVYAKGGGGMGGNGMHGGGMGNAGADHAQQNQHRTQTREQTREAAQGSQDQGNAYRYENREQMRNTSGLPSMQ